MTTNYPGALDDFPIIDATDQEDAAGKEHHSVHNNEMAAIAALQKKLGVTGSDDPSSIDYRVSSLEHGVLHYRRTDLTASGGETRISTVSRIYENSAELFLNGVLLPTSAYEQISERVLMLSAAAAAGDKYYVRHLTIDATPSAAIWVVPLTLSGAYTNKGRVDEKYSSDLVIAGGDGVYSNPRVISGALPSGLSLSIVSPNLLRLSGVPTSTYSGSFTVAVDSGDTQTATSVQTLEVEELYYSVVLRSNPAGYWPCDDTGTVLTDISGNGRHGTIADSIYVVKGAPPLIARGTASLKTTDRVGYAATIPCPTLGAEWSIEAIISEPNNDTSWPAKCVISGNAGSTSTNGNPAIYYNGGWALSPTPHNYVGAGDLKGTVHAVIRKDLYGYSFWVNGVLRASGSSISTPGATIYLVGGGPDFPGSYSIIGSISDVAIYNRALAGSEILAHAVAAGLA